MFSISLYELFTVSVVSVSHYVTGQYQHTILLVTGEVVIRDSEKMYLSDFFI
jgi:hypothetical protein